MVISDDGPGADFDDQTVVDGTPLVDEEVTPDVTPRCVECGSVVFVDTVAPFQSFPDDRCLRAGDGQWHWCAKLRKSVTFVPR